MAYKKLKFWFDRELAELLIAKLEDLDPRLDSQMFVSRVTYGVRGKELKERIEVFADAFRDSMDHSFPEIAELFIGILGPENPNETGMFREYYWIMPMAFYIEKYGLNHFDASIKAIEEITKRNTGEYAIRPFIDSYPDKTLEVIFTWTKNTNLHVRRLASEGVRPRLPWSTKLQRFIDDPSPIIPILNQLKDDPSRYVQRSVGNCLNDIIKDNRTVAEAVIEDWVIDPGERRRWIIHHALRNLRKGSDPWAKHIMEIINP